MREELAIWVAASAAAIFTIASSVFDVLLASSVPAERKFSALRALLFAALSLQLSAVGCIAYFCLIFTRRRKAHPYRLAWIEPSSGAGFNVIALAANGVALVWLTIRQHDLPDRHGLREAGLTVWALAITLHGAFFMLLATYTKRMLMKRKPKKQVDNFGISLPSPRELAFGTRPSFCSRDTTLASASRPQTPRSSRTYSLHSSTTRVASSVRSKFARGSARSSLDLPPFPAGEATALGSAFDRYDTSNIDTEVRNTIICSSPIHSRNGPTLEPIPGSRPGSAADDLTNLAFPDPPVRERPQSPPSNARPSPFDTIPSTPPSSPPNFSRPTSRSQHRTPTPLKQPRVSASMTDFIHPLFRPNSPSPPRILSPGTSVTASPNANQPITPKTLSRLRSASDLHSRGKVSMASGALSMSPNGQWRVMPVVELLPPTRPRSKSHASVMNTRPSTAGSDSAQSTKSIKTDTMGSPGPSILEEDELPPILPGFVLSAGSRSSLVGYGKRKSVKRSSAHLS